MATIGNQQPAEQERFVRAQAGMQAQLHARADSHDDESAPRVVTTGGRTDNEGTGDAVKHPLGVDLETGEPVEIKGTLHGFSVTRRLTPSDQVPASAAFIDALAFTVIPPDDMSMKWVLAEMRQFLPIEDLQSRKGCFGFQESLRFGNGAGLIAWGGASQKGRVYFSIQGLGCSLVEDWAGLAHWLELSRATIKRVDVAYDDFAGEFVSIDWALKQYHGGGFTSCGRTPSSCSIGDWHAKDGSTAGRTLGIGKRQNGKYCRIYEKGKQLGDPDSAWTRLEIEWRGQDRLIPYDVLSRPGPYLAGAYPCLAHLDVEQARIKTIAHSATIELDAAVANAKHQFGKLVNFLLMVNRGDCGQVVEDLRRDGVPARMEGYLAHLGDSPEMLDPSSPGSFASIVQVLANAKP